MTESETREIEELRKALSVSYWGEDCHIDWEETARENYQQGIRKIPDGAVVLTQEMAYSYREDLTKVQYLKDEIRKETAREYYKKMTQEIESHNFENSFDYECMNASNNEIVKEFGAEVEE